MLCLIIAQAIYHRFVCVHVKKKQTKERIRAVFFI